MQKVINATFDGKVLHPENSIKIEPNTRVRLTIELFEKSDKKSGLFFKQQNPLKLTGLLTGLKNLRNTSMAKIKS